ncbi:MAG TPA: 50S ribosomal protein L15 [Patescibacteria group bacterium]|uniref:Large ribosomal subunit protein uL15 n=1 Tax=uncultured Berkelbacteria bacterium Rifle_16ft_4_minimus_38443 TaxID=1665092 RepID=A0A0H4TS50_9BACT|nr:LSU ribosomal protein L15p (L27Ae) [uncultured Berkelbacteria bacterium Rifle_16ft_4_minimus_38443]HLC38629.1 50S ribosomal protein L15 [Patescibacteria group bacterium]
MKQHTLKPIMPRKKKKRVGRGIGSGYGKTAGRGTKGLKSRTGYNLPIGFEGGQTPLKMRLPKKKGFFRNRPKTRVINLEQINKTFTAKEIVSPKTLLEKGLIKTENTKIKILANGKIDHALTFEGLAISKNAQKKIEKTSGSIKVVSKKVTKTPPKKSTPKATKQSTKDKINTKGN